MARAQRPQADPAEVESLRDAGLSPVRARRLALLRAVARAEGKEAARVTFAAYIAARPRTDDPRGDFAGDFRFDRRKPDVRTLAELRAYLRSRRWPVGGVRPEVVAVAASVWGEYEATIRDALAMGHESQTPHHP